MVVHGHSRGRGIEGKAAEPGWVLFIWGFGGFKV